MEVESVLAQVEGPIGELSSDDGVVTLDVRELGPPQPLVTTLETLEEMDESVLIQYNDRAPQHLYPKLTDRAYQYETIETENAVVTVIWSE